MTPITPTITRQEAPYDFSETVDRTQFSGLAQAAVDALLGSFAHLTRIASPSRRCRAQSLQLIGERLPLTTFEHVWPQLSTSLDDYIAPSGDQVTAFCAAWNVHLVDNVGLVRSRELGAILVDVATIPPSTARGPMRHNVETLDPGRVDRLPSLQAPSEVHPSLEAVKELCEWLGQTEEEVAELAGFAVRSIANWRRGRRPYPATVRRLRQIHALVRALIDLLGVSRTRLWLFEKGSASVSTRLELLRTDAGLATVVDEAAGMLYERPHVGERMEAEFSEHAIEDAFRLAPRPEVMQRSLRSRKLRETD